MNTLNTLVGFVFLLIVVFAFAGMIAAWIISRFMR